MKTPDQNLAEFFDAYFGYHDDLEGKICIWAKSYGTKYYSITELNSAIEFIRQADEKHDVYFHVTTHSSEHAGDRGTNLSSRELVALWADIDFKDTQKPDYPSQEKVQELLTKLPLKPSIIISTGGGLHAYWLLKEIENSQEYPDVGKEWQRYLRNRLGAPMDSTGERARVLRIPTTHSKKRNQLVEIVDADYQRRYSIEDFQEFLLVPSIADENTLGSAEISKANLILNDTHNPPNAKISTLCLTNQRFKMTWLRARSDLPDQTPSGYCMALANQTVKAGFSDQEILDTMLEWRKMHNCSLDLDNPQKHLRTIAKARKQLIESNGISESIDSIKDSPGESIRPIYRCFKDIQPTPVEWLWKGFIAKGKVIIIAGEPGLGKSQITASLAAIVSQGLKWPVTGEECPQGSVILLSAEDHAADTIRPRLDAAKANCEQVHILDAVRDSTESPEKPRDFNINRDLEALRRMILDIPNVALVVIDPISAYLGNLDSHNNSQVRGALAPLQSLAEDLNVAVVTVSHLNKSSSQSAIHRITGSGAFAAAARAVFCVCKESSGSPTRLFVPVKNNIGVDDQSLSFQIESVDLGDGVTTSKIVWNENFCQIDVNEKLSGPPKKSSKTDEAEDWLASILEEGPMDASKIHTLGDPLGFTKKILHNASTRLGIIKNRNGMNGGWVWKLE